MRSDNTITSWGTTSAYRAYHRDHCFQSGYVENCQHLNGSGGWDIIDCPSGFEIPQCPSQP